MPQLNSRARHCACSGPKGIQWYLEEKVPGRALERGFCNMLNFQTVRWDKTFDYERMIWRNHLPYHGKSAVQYTHFDLSPDPLDNPTSVEVLEYAHEWAEHFFGDRADEGVLGCFQVAIVVHDDNENGIMHAHVVVNNTNLVNGKRLQINNAQNKHTLPDYAQDLARERGWRYFDNTPDHKWVKSEAHLPLLERRAILPEGSTRTIVERRMAERGRAVWKDNLRTKVAVAKNVSQTEAQFVAACATLGVSVRKEDGDCVFGLDFEGRRTACTGQHLGPVYFGAGVEGRRTLVMQMPTEDAARLRENVLKAMMAAQSVSVAIPGDSGLSQRQIAAAIATMRRHDITNAPSLDRALKKCGTRMGKSVGIEKKKHRMEYACIKNVEELARKIGLFEGVSDNANRAARIRELEAQECSTFRNTDTAREITALRGELHSLSPARMLPPQSAGMVGSKAFDSDNDQPCTPARSHAPVRNKTH